MTQIFISYSRKDKAFAEKLNVALEAIHLESWIDWDDIPPTADWWEKIQDGIESADAFIFLLSPDSATSKVCREEIDHATKNGKRLIPLVVRDASPNDVHPALAKLNWIFFREQDDFDISLKKLELGIKTDLAWVEFHRRLQVRAVEWEKHKDASLLLRGKDLRQAEEQLATAGQKDPQPTDLQRQYVLESRRRESRTRNSVLVISAVVMVALAFLAVFALNQRDEATAQRNLANNNAGTAIANQHVAETAQANAERERTLALSNGLSSNALLLQEQNEISLALLLSIQANKFYETARSRNALYTLLKQNEYMIAALELPKGLLDETFPSYATDMRNDRLLVKLFDYGKPNNTQAQYILWDLNTFQLLDNQVFPRDTAVTMDKVTGRLIPNENGNPFDGMMNWDSIDQLYLGPFQNKVEDVILFGDEKTAVATYCKFAKSMAGRCTGATVYIFTNEHPFFEPQITLTPKSAMEFMELAYSADNQLFALTDAGNGTVELWRYQDKKLQLIDTYRLPGFISRRDSRGFVFIPDQHLIAWGTTENKIRVWDTTAKKIVQEFNFNDLIIDFEISPDGLISAVQDDAGIRLFSITENGLQPLEIRIDSEIKGAMGFSADGKVFAVGSGNEIWVFNTNTGDQIARIGITSTGDSDVRNLFVSSDGRTIAVGMDPTNAGPIPKMYLIDVQSGVETGPFEDVLSPVLSRDNKYLVSAGAYLNQDIFLWDLDVESWKNRACQIANRNLTHAEWGQYMGNEPYQQTCQKFPDPG